MRTYTICVSVCVCVCVFLCAIKNTDYNYTKFLWTLDLYLQLYFHLKFNDQNFFLNIDN